MLRLLVVDDEAVHLMNLIGSIQTIRPSYIIFSARDGSQALDMMKAFQIDALITDIRMPKMDGLTLVKEAKKLYPDLYTLILSGYGEFEYAQKAIELGINGYLLKMLSPTELASAVDEMEEEIQKRRELHMIEDSYQKNLICLKQSRLERKLEDLVNGHMQPGQAKEALEAISSMNSGMIICTKYTDSLGKEDDMERYRQRLDDFLRAYGGVCTFQSASYPQSLITILLCTNDNAVRCSRDMPGFLRYALPENAILSVSAYHEKLSDRIGLGFHQASEAAEQMFYEPDRSFFSYHSQSAMQPFIMGHVRLPIEAVQEYITAGNGKAASELLCQIVREYIDQYHPYPSKIKELLIFCMWRICCDLDKAVSREETHRLMVNVEQMISNSRTITELKCVIYEIFEQIRVTLEDRRRKSTDSAIEAAGEILRSEYMKPWSLADLAERVHFNPSYFSSLFKQHFGKGYADYLNDVRMEHAARMLLTSDIQVGQLANELGYQSSAYFIKVFKASFGITPNEFRRGNDNAR